MDASAENKNKYVALAFTIGFHALLFLLFVLIVFITPIPAFEIKPIPEIEIGLGIEGMGDMDAGGSGQNDTDIATSQDAPSNPIENNDAPNIVTDDSEPTVVVKSNPKSNKENTTEAPVLEQPKASSELLDALAVLKTKNKHKGKGEGVGNTGGSGNGSKQGVGDGDGTGHGDGTPGFNGKGGYDLKGRMLVKKPARMTDSQEEGIVVVEIIVNENGKVIKATAGQRGSTTTSSNLYGKARQAAFEAKFNPSPDGIKEQRGTYTFVFTLE
jgi:TonB family protein